MDERRRLRVAWMRGRGDRPIFALGTSERRSPPGTATDPRGQWLGAFLLHGDTWGSLQLQALVWLLYLERPSV